MPAYIENLLGDGDFKSGPTGVDGVGLAVVFDAADQSEAYDVADEYYPAVVGGIPRGSIDVKEKVVGRLYLIEVDYSSSVRDRAENANGIEPGDNPGAQGTGEGGGNPAGDKTGDEEVTRKYSVSTKGGTQHIKRSWHIVSRHAPNGADPATIPANEGNWIGFHDGDCDGTDIIAPSPEFTISVTLPRLTLGYFLRVMATTGKINNAPIWGLGTAEVLFAGADFSSRDGKNKGWDSNFYFKYSPSEHDVPITDDFVVPFKAGWHCLDVWYEKIIDPGPNKLASRPFAAYVHQVYKYAQFEDLNLRPLDQ